MSLSVVNLGYFLIGVFLFLLMKFVDRFDYFQEECKWQIKIARVWNYIFGLISVLLVINGFFTLIQIYSFTGILDYMEVVPLTIMIISIPIFLSDSFRKPSKNYLISLGIGTAIGAIGLALGLILAGIGFERLMGHYQIYASYLYLIPLVIFSMLGVLISVIFYHSFLKPRMEQWNEELFDLDRIWKLLNNKYLLLMLSIITFVEIYFQWNSLSILSIFIITI
ncbi:MAG: hypothetical protein ACXQS8_08180 [Candidatus Helarchaeales archaeon]